MLQPPLPEQRETHFVPLVAEAIPLGPVIVTYWRHAGRRDVVSIVSEPQNAILNADAPRVVLQPYHAEIAKPAEVSQITPRIALPRYGVL